MKIAIRTDAGPLIGTGHVMRCIALAQAARLAGHDVHLIGHVTVPWVKDRLLAEKITTTFLEGEAPDCESPQTLLAQISLLGEVDWVVLDGYRFHLDCQKAVRESGYKLLYIDDYAHLPEYSCDILLNQNIGAEQLCYLGDIAERLLGRRFTLLHPKFLKARGKNIEKVFPQAPQRVLITLGGGDYTPFLSYVAQTIADSPYAKCEILVLQGGVPVDTITDIFSSHSLRVKVLPPSSDLASFLLDVDLCVTAGGSTCWELCCLGVPFLVLQIAENQKYVVSNLVNAGLTKVFSSQSLVEFHKCGDMTATRSTLMKYVDGEGTRRAVKAMVLATLQISQVVQEDCWDIYALTNEPEARRFSQSSKAITEKEHELWFLDRLKRVAEPFLVAHLYGKGIAYARLDSYKSGFIVSIAVAKEARGFGVGTTLLNKLLQDAHRVWGAGIYASIHKTNHLSKKMFETAGFTQVASPPTEAGRPKEFFLYRYMASS